MSGRPAHADATSPGPRQSRTLWYFTAGGLGLLALTFGAHCATERYASASAKSARDALRVGSSCRDLVAIAERYANRDSMQEVRAACSSPQATRVTLNFSRWLSLNYLITVDLSSQGNVSAVSEVGAW